MGYTGQLALGAAGFMAAGAFAMFNLILRVPDLGFVGSLIVSGLSYGSNISLTVFYYMDDR